jgi:hypothetical protein
MEKSFFIRALKKFAAKPIRHSRAGGNPGLFPAELAWIPAFAGMT